MTNNELAEDLAKSLASTMALMHTLLSELQNNAAALAVLKEKFDALGDKVRMLSKLITDDNGSKSVITRLTMIEKELEDLEEDIGTNNQESKVQDRILHERITAAKCVSEETTKSEIKHGRAKSMGRLKFAGSVLPGLVALGIVLVKFFLGV